MTKDPTTGTHPSTDLHVEVSGAGTPVVLVHGSLATAAEEWEVQRPLADQGFHLLAPDRRGDGAARRPRARTSCATQRTSPRSWATAPTWSVTPSGASAYYSPPPAVPRQSPTSSGSSAS